MNKRAQHVVTFRDTQARLATEPTLTQAIQHSHTFVDWPLPNRHPAALTSTTIIEHWRNTTTLQAVFRCWQRQPDHIMGVLNFASARHPGGGVERGASAQEESLCRASGLWPCLVAQPRMYTLNNHNAKQGLYHHCGIVSPRVPLLKNDDGELLPTPIFMNVLSMPAVNAMEARRHQIPEATINLVMAERLAHVLALAYHTGQKELVLGAFGCGVFGNNIERVAAQWQTLLSTTFKHCFHRIIFATINDHEYTALARVVRGE